MNAKSFDVVDFDGFVNRYMRSVNEPLAAQAEAVKIYPLSVALMRIQCPTPLFKLDHNFLLLFRNGGGEQQVDNDVISLEPNDALFMREGHLNAVKWIAPSTQGYYIHIAGVVLPQIIGDATLLHRLTFHPKHSVSAADMEWMCRCCELALLQNSGGLYAQEVRIALLKSIVLKLAEASPTALCKPDRPTEVTFRFKELLYRHVNDNRNVGFYASALAVSENYLNRCVVQTTNKPSKQHINEMLIARSKVLLQDRSKDIGEIAHALNFADPSYFGRFFKQHTRQTPKAYRVAALQALSQQVQD